MAGATSQTARADRWAGLQPNPLHSSVRIDPVRIAETAFLVPSLSQLSVSTEGDLDLQSAAAGGLLMQA